MRWALPLLVAWLLGSPALSGAESPRQAAANRVAEAELRDDWVDRYREARSRVEEARASLDKARAAYAEGRHRKRLHGAKKLAVIEALERAEQELDDALQELASIPEAAHRAGALPGWLRDLED